MTGDVGVCIMCIHRVYVYFICREMEIKMVTQTARLSATVPKHIIDEADEIAALERVSRSQLISQCLTDMIERRKRALLADGYKAMAKQHEEFASLSEDVAKEVVPNW